MTDVRRAAPQVRRLSFIGLSAAIAVGLVGAAAQKLQDHAHRRAELTASRAPAEESWRPVNNDCSGGHIVFTFDDGPGASTTTLLDRMERLNLKGVFFVATGQIDTMAEERAIQREAAAGHIVANHTHDHHDLVTGTDVEGRVEAVWGDEQIAGELEQASDRIVQLGLPRPTLYRPPYGSVDANVDTVAAALGYRLVMSWPAVGGTNLVDSMDYSGKSASEIVQTVTAAMKPGLVITMHDGHNAEATLNSIAALQPIVDRMNELHLCSTTDVPADASGGIAGADWPQARNSEGH